MIYGGGCKLVNDANGLRSWRLYVGRDGLCHTNAGKTLQFEAPCTQASLRSA